MPIFLLVRHAESPWSPDQMRPLSPAGHTAAERLADHLDQPRIAAIYTSPYLRARQTVTPLAHRRGLPIEELPDLREREFGNPTGLAFEQAVAATFEDFDLAHPGGESSRLAQRRAVFLIDHLLSGHPDRPIVLATHGNLLTLLLNHFDPEVGFDFWRSLAFPDVVRLSVSTSRSGASIERLSLPAA